MEIGERKLISRSERVSTYSRTIGGKLYEFDVYRRYGKTHLIEAYELSGFVYRRHSFGSLYGGNK